jgi:AraC-like DNA-binding protein
MICPGAKRATGDVDFLTREIERRRASLQHIDMFGGRPDKAARLSAILHLIETRSSAVELSVAMVARLLGVTSRYVHLLLRQTGKTFGRHVLEARLQKAAALLLDPLWRERRIGEIALESGFGDLSHFNRAFRRRFGMTPSAMREAAQGRR